MQFVQVCKAFCHVPILPKHNDRNREGHIPWLCAEQFLIMLNSVHDKSLEINGVPLDNLSRLYTMKKVYLICNW